MNLDLIHGVTRTKGILAPRGARYVPASQAELQSILSRVSSSAMTGAVGGGQPQSQAHHDYVSFRLGPDLHYVDLLTATEDIRSRRLDELATDIPYEEDCTAPPPAVRPRAPLLPIHSGHRPGSDI